MLKNYQLEIFVVVVILVTITLVTIIRRILTLLINRSSKKINSDPTNFVFLKNSLSFIIYSTALFIIFQKIPYLRSLGNALFAGAGVFAAIVGFASQKAFSNIVSGIFILVFKPFKVNDLIEFAGRYGVVEEITLRHTIIRDFENKRIIIPNSGISEETIINSNISDNKIRKIVEFDISYDSDVNLAEKIIEEEALKHPLTLDNRTRQEKKDNHKIVMVRVVNLGDFSVKLRAYIWCKDYGDAFTLKCDLLKSVKERFDKNGIEIPFPYRTIVMKEKKNETQLAPQKKRK